MNILLFEDDEGVAFLTRDVLAKEKFEVSIASRGKPGIEMFKNRKYDVVILDQIMPDLSGLEVFKKIQAVSHDIVAVMVTGSGDEQIAVRAMKMGVVDYIVKSVDMNYLKTLPLVIRKAVEQKGLLLEKEQLRRELEEANKELKLRNRALAIKLKMLESFEKTTLDRERRILELKNEIRELKKHIFEHGEEKK